MSKLLHFIVKLARELSDEGAYCRHLELTGSPHSGEEWRKFSEEKMRAKYSKAKCC